MVFILTFYLWNSLKESLESLDILHDDTVWDCHVDITFIVEYFLLWSQDVRLPFQTFQHIFVSLTEPFKDLRMLVQFSVLISFAKLITIMGFLEHGAEIFLWYFQGGLCKIMVVRSPSKPGIQLEFHKLHLENMLKQKFTWKMKKLHSELKIV